MRLVLASTSPHRRSLLERLGFPFEIVDPRLDETPFKREGIRPDELVVRLAEAKARAVLDAFPGSLVVGSDQCAEVDGRILGKPGSFEAAVDQLASLAGKTHRLLTGTCVLDTKTGVARTDLDVHRMTMRKLDRRQLEGYAMRDRPFDCAGAYRVESCGIALFERIEGIDHSAIVGLPLMRLAMLLAEAGLDVLLPPSK